MTRICNYHWGSAALVGVLLLSSVSSSQGEVVTDGTVGPQRNLSGPNYLIDPGLGTTRGANLFHSFQTFNINAAESATFTGPDTIANVISRVTGGEVSNIDGLLRSEVGKADFYFINPAGVVFGPKARVDVPAAFHLGTADELRFEDGAVFSATNPNTSTLSAAPPDAFGFLSPQPASLTVNGSRLEFTPESRASLVAKDIAVQNGASLYSEGGDIRLTAVGDSSQTVDLTTSSASSPVSGSISIDDSSIGVSGYKGSETIELRGGDIEISNSVIAAHNGGVVDNGGRILLEANDVQVVNSLVHSWVFGAGRGNDILVVAGDLDINAANTEDGYSGLTTGVYYGASGKAGDVLVDAERVSLTDGGKLSSIADFGSLGSGGTVEVITGLLYIDNGGLSNRSTGIETSAELLASGNAGDIIVRADSLYIDGRGAPLTGISSYAQDLSAGDAGNVQVEVDGDIVLRNLAHIFSDTYGSGNAGTVLVKAAGDLEVLNGGVIRSYTDELGNAGIVQVQVGGAMVLRDGARISSDTFGAGDAGSVVVSSGDMRIAGDAQTGITSEAHVGSLGRAGPIIITVDELLELRDQGKISSTSFAGDAGRVQVRAGRLNMVGKGDPLEYTYISSDAGLEAFGVAGTVDIRVDGLMQLSDGALISAGSGGSATDSTAGSVVIHAGELDMNGGDAFALISAQSLFSAGDAGSVEITVDGAMKMHDATGVSATSQTTGLGGAVIVQADSLSLEGGVHEAEISSEAIGVGAGGSVQVTVNGLLELRQGGVISSGTFAEGDGGTIDIQSGRLYMAGNGSEWLTGITSAANSESSGFAGDIKVHIDGSLTILEGAQILADTFAGGDAGGIEIESGSLLIDGAGTTERYTGITSGTEPNSIGNAGTTHVLVHGQAELRGGGGISSATLAQGDAGEIFVQADELYIDGGISTIPSAISSEAGVAATGSVGNVDIRARRLVLSNGGEISIAAAQTQPTSKLATNPVRHILVQADDLLLQQGARITAESSGNVAAAAIEIQAANLLRMTDASAITTSAAEADGGPITIGGGTLWMTDSLITTSVEGEVGNGGNIDLNPEFLVMDGGFIQANTAAPGASGGDISIDTRALVASHGEVQVGGIDRLTFMPNSGLNIIQAASPAGNPGNINIIAPELDISGALASLSTGFVETARLISDPCADVASQSASSLVQGSRGGIPEGPDVPTSLSYMDDRLDRLLSEQHQASSTDGETISIPIKDEADSVDRCRGGSR